MRSTPASWSSRTSENLGERRHCRLGKTRGRLVHEDETAARSQELRATPSRRSSPCGSEPAGVSAYEVELKRFEEAVGATSRLARPRSNAEPRNLDVLPHRQTTKRSAVLEGPGETCPPAPVRPPARDVAAFELDRSLVREVEPGEDVHERRLAGAVRADEADDLVPVQLERDVAERLHAVEGTRDAGGPERGSGPP